MRPTLKPTMISVLNDASIRDAVNAWLYYRTTAILKYGYISTWNTSLVTNMHSLFSYWSNYVSYNFNDDLSRWDVSRVTDMTQMFYYASSFNGNISSWDTSKVTSMNGMFFYAASFNSPITSWDTSRVTDMNYIFYYASQFNQVLCWNLQSLYSPYLMFEGSRGSFSRLPYPKCNFPSPKPTVIPTAKPSVKPSPKPSSTRAAKPTLDDSILITARFVKITRVLQSPYADYFIHILGVDVYDGKGTFISDKCKCTMSSIHQNYSSCDFM